MTTFIKTVEEMKTFLKEWLDNADVRYSPGFEGLLEDRTHIRGELIDIVHSQLNTLRMEFHFTGYTWLYRGKDYKAIPARDGFDYIMLVS